MNYADLLEQIDNGTMTEATLLTPNSYGNTPVHLLAAHGKLDLVFDLLSKEMLLTPNKFGDTPVHLLEIDGHLEANRDLLESFGIDTSFRIDPADYDE